MVRELPRDVKAACGYSPVGGRTPNPAIDKDADQKETFIVARPQSSGPANAPGASATR